MVYFFIDESGFNEQSLSMLSCIITDAPESIRHEINQLKDDILHNQRYSEILGKFSENGFHHTENPFEIRSDFIDLLSQLTFQAYICFVDSSEEMGHRNEIYDRIFGRIIYDRLRDYRYQPITICFEQHDPRKYRRLEELQEIASGIDGKIKSLHQITGVDAPIVLSSGKDEPCLAIADYICAVFTNYYKKLHSGDVKKGEPFEKRNFDELSGKIRLIHDYGNDTFYSRGKPFPDMS